LVRKIGLALCILFLVGCGKYTMEEAKENGDIIVQKGVENSDRLSMTARRISIRLMHHVISSVQQTTIERMKSVSNSIKRS